MRKDTPTIGVKLTTATDTLRDECAVRFRDAVRASVPNMARKKVARILNASPETVDGWIDSESPRMPSTKHLLAAFSVFGPAFTAYVLHPCGSWVRGLFIEAKMENLRDEIASLKREIDALAPTDTHMGYTEEMRDSLEKGQALIEKAEMLTKE